MITLDDTRSDVLTAAVASSDPHRLAEYPTALPTRQLYQTLDKAPIQPRSQHTHLTQRGDVVLSMQLADRAWKGGT